MRVPWFTKNLSEIEKLNYELDKAKFNLKREIRISSDYRKQIYYHIEENKVLKQKLELFEKNPEEYHRRKSMDPFSEENWED